MLTSSIFIVLHCSQTAETYKGDTIISWHKKVKYLLFPCADIHQQIEFHNINKVVLLLFWIFQRKSWSKSETQPQNRRLYNLTGLLTIMPSKLWLVLRRSVKYGRYKDSINNWRKLSIISSKLDFRITMLSYEHWHCSPKDCRLWHWIF